MTQQTLEQLLIERIKTYTTSERPVELIDAGIDKMFKDVVDDAFRSYGDFAKSIKEAVKAAMPANVSDFIQLERYNALIANVLKERWSSLGVESNLVEKANASIDEIFSDGGVLKAEYTLSELMKAFIEEHKEQAADDHWERPTVRLEEDDSHSLTFIHLYFDPEPEDSGSYRSRKGNHALKHNLHMMVNETRKSEENWRDDDQVCEVYAAKLDDKKIGVNMRMRSKWEKIIAALYFGNAKLIIDCDPTDYSYGLYD